MIGSRLAAALLLIVTGLAAGCNDSSTTPTTPTNPVTETLTGTITQNGVNVQPFNAAAAGTVIATITTLAPDSTITVGFSMGTYSGTTCQVVLDNPVAVQGAILTANAATAGSFCVRLYDVGKIAAGSTVDFTVTVVHN
jgi:pimeloyl-ACP methyl ester carboxylesterase